IVFFFFFQAEDGIRDFHVTGVQTCALPIYEPFALGQLLNGSCESSTKTFFGRIAVRICALVLDTTEQPLVVLVRVVEAGNSTARSEERRVGKECRCRWWAYH